MEMEKFFVVSGNDSSLSRRFLCANPIEKTVLVKAPNIAEAIDNVSSKMFLDFYIAVEATQEDIRNIEIEFLE